VALKANGNEASLRLRPFQIVSLRVKQSI
jgi:hypothetical protein